MSSPIIGVVPLVDYQQDSYWMLPDYFTAIESVGGIPVMLPLVDDHLTLSELLSSCAGILITGGQDIEPAVYGEEKLAVCGECSPERDSMERALLELTLEREMPVFGICRGIQSINTSLGGTLYQDLATQHPSPIRHKMERPYDREAHTVSLIPETPLARLLEGVETLSVNSCHHQAIHSLAPDLLPMAVTPDGLVEAVYLPDHPFLWAVQWHPERLYRKDGKETRIFKAFVDHCREYTKKAGIETPA